VKSLGKIVRALVDRIKKKVV